MDNRALGVPFFLSHIVRQFLTVTVSDGSIEYRVSQKLSNIPSSFWLQWPNLMKFNHVTIFALECTVRTVNTISLAFLAKPLEVSTTKMNFSEDFQPEISVTWTKTNCTKLTSLCADWADNTLWNNNFNAFTSEYISVLDDTLCKFSFIQRHTSGTPRKIPDTQVTTWHDEILLQWRRFWTNTQSSRRAIVKWVQLRRPVHQLLSTLHKLR
jgi:hypothetical protein